MKRLANNFICAAAMMLAAAVAFSACTPQDEKVTPKVEVSQNEITSESAGETYDITVTSNVAWNAQIANKDTWVTVKPASGQAGETAVKVTVKKNNSDAQRETSITFTGETATATVAVKQFGKDVVTIDKNTYEVTPAGGSDAVKVTANTEWTATVSEGADWVTVAPATGAAGETTATVTVAANETSAARTAKVTFTAGSATAEYTISQEAVSVTLSKSSIADAGEGKTEAINVTANAAWTAASNAEWVTIAPASGAAGVTEVAVTVAENSTEAAREAKVTFTINENVTAELTVTQAFVAQAGKVEINISDITATKAKITCTPDPLTGFTYYYYYLPKYEADILCPTDEEKIDFLVQAINDALAQYAGALTWADVVAAGVAEDTFTGLDPLTEYYAVAFGVDADGNVTSKLYKTEFTTKDLNPALKQWIGTWNLTASDAYHLLKDGTEGLAGKPVTKTITIGTSSIFDLELGENDLIISGLSYTDYLPLYTNTSTGEVIPIEAIANVQTNGDLYLMNGVETLMYGKYGLLTWRALSYIEMGADSGWYPVGGEYPGYTLKFGADKTTATGTPYSGKIQSGETFTVGFYDVVLADGNNISILFTDNTTGALSGNWTLTKVQSEPTAAPKSMKIETKLAKEMKIKENNLVMNLNSSYLYKSVQAR